ncbi:hypothetical protein EY643_03870 [Halioglobus maricola]|uniref:Midcut-by-XrtH protein n=1 Tax=Halioglobus maricola TaxID=2601894 RepID=A0A5P9NH47_9GAMM|nr:hypothetical protein [Halioglobus maricola]QFU74849.1 hypothetical protein EY643_03870 [Halioglobus maricola]
MNTQRLAAWSALPLSLISAISHGSVPGSAIMTVTMAPTPAPPAAPDAGAMAPAVPVPVMDSLLLVVAGLLMVAIAVRFLRSNKNAQKLMSICVLGAGLVITGIGADRTIAAVTIDYPLAPDCSGADLSVDALLPGQIVNDCDDPQDIISIETETEAGSECLEVIVLGGNEGTCEAGATLGAGESCTTDLYTEEFSSALCPPT